MVSWIMGNWVAGIEFQSDSLHSCSIRANTIGEGMNPSLLRSAMAWIAGQTRLYNPGWQRIYCTKNWQLTAANLQTLSFNMYWASIEEESHKIHISHVDTQTFLMPVNVTYHILIFKALGVFPYLTFSQNGQKM